MRFVGFASDMGIDAPAAGLTAPMPDAPTISAPGTADNSFNSDHWNALASNAEQEVGLPSGLLNAIKNTGERSNANQVSSAGARTPFQIIPSTRDLFLKKYGVDAYADDASAAKVAALHLKESLDRGESVEDAVGEYHGGPDRKNWGPINAAYRQRVTGALSGAAPQSQPQSQSPRRMRFVGMASDLGLVDKPAVVAPVPENQGSFAGDIGRNLKVGANIAAQDVRELVGGIPGVGPSIVKGLDEVDRYFQGMPSDQLLNTDTEKAIKGMTPEMQQALKKTWWDSDAGKLGPAWSDWRAYLGGLAQSAPEQLMMMAPSMLLAKASYAARIAAGAPEAIAAKAAARTATISGGVTEGMLGGAQSSRQVRQEIMNLPDATLQQSDAYKALLSGGMTPDQARASLADDLSTRAFVTSGVLTGLFGGIGDRAIVKIVTDKAGSSVMKRIAAGVGKGVVGEGSEELFQSGLQQAAQNEAVQQANPNQSLTEGVVNQALGGLAIGAVLGGGMGGAVTAFQSSEKPEPGASDAPSGPTIDPLAGAPSAPDLSAATPATPGPATAGQAPDEGVTTTDKISGLPLADAGAIFDKIKARPAILDTIDKVLAEQPQADGKAELKAAIESMQANPAEIFNFAATRPEIYNAIAKATDAFDQLESQAPRNVKAAVPIQPGVNPAQAIDEMAAASKRALDMGANRPDILNTISQAQADTQAGLERAAKVQGVPKVATPKIIKTNPPEQSLPFDAQPKAPIPPHVPPKKVKLTRKQFLAKQNTVSSEDSMLTAIAKMGGLNRQQLTSEWGIDPASVKGMNPVFGKPVARVNGGLSLDDMAERLVEAGYLDQRDLREFENKFDRELRGTPVYSSHGGEERMNDEQRREAEIQDEDRASRTNGADDLTDLVLTPSELESDGFNAHDEAGQQAVAELVADLRGRFKGREAESAIEDIIERAAIQTSGQSSAQFKRAIAQLLKEFIDGNENTSEQPAQSRGRADRGDGEKNVPADRAEGSDGRENRRDEEGQTRAPSLTLTAQTPDELRAKQEKIDEAERKTKADQAKAEAKEAADRDREEFDLTGSDRAADANSKQADLLQTTPPNEGVSNSEANKSDQPKRDTQTAEAKTKGAGEEEVKSAEQHDAEVRAMGRTAGERGDPRDPPEALPNGDKQVWRTGWDDSKRTKRTPQVPPPKTAVKQAADETPAKASGEKIVDVGEKIGGARKDTSTPVGTRLAKAEVSDEPAWRKRFTVSQIAKSGNPAEEGRWTLRDTKRKDWFGHPKQIGATFATEEEAKKAIPLAAVSQKHRVVPTREGGKFEIWRDVTDRKRVKVLDQQFDSREAAMAYLATHAEQIMDTKTSFGEEILPHPETVVRTGKTRRKGDASGQDFLDDFSLRAVEFGNWNNQAERQEVMNHAYDALMDLSEMLNIPPKAIGLNGELGLAFGARGQGLSGARAHYERNYGVINLTKMSGAGSLAHEWFHALDHYLARQDGKTGSERIKNERGDSVFPAKGSDSDFSSHGFSYKSKVREELQDAYAKLIQGMFTKAEAFVEDSQKAEEFVGRARSDLAHSLEQIRIGLTRGPESLTHMKRHNKPASAEQLSEFDGIAQKLLAGEFLNVDWRSIGNPGRNKLHSGRMTNDALEQLSAIYKAVRGRTGFDSTNQSGIFDDVRGRMRRFSERLKMLADAQASTEKTKRVPTSFAMQAKSLDQGRSTDYWMSEHEMAARAFEAYVEDKVRGAGDQSDFLAFGTHSVLPTPWGWVRPYPEGKEREAMDALFDKFFSVVKTRETEGGKVAVFSRSTTESPARNTTVRLQSPQVVHSERGSERKVLKQSDVVNVPDKSANSQADAKLFRDDEIKSSGLTQKAIEGVRDRLGVEAKIVRSESDLPASLRKSIQSAGAEGTVRGLFDPVTKDVYLVADNLHSAEEAAFVALHESAHRGLRVLFGDDLKSVLHALYHSNKNLAAEAEVRMKRFGISRMEATEEAVADMAYRGVARDLTGWQKLVQFIRDWLVKRGIAFKFSDDAILSIAGAAARAGRTKEASLFTDSDTAFSRDADGVGHDAQSLNALFSRSEKQIKTDYRARATRAIERFESASGLDPLGHLPDKQKYLASRYQTLGKIANVDEVANGIRNVFSKASEADRKAAYEYFTTAGATPDAIVNATVRKSAQQTKSLIGQVGDAMVARGLLEPDSREEYRDRYLPRLYLKHMLSESDWRAFGGGKKPSDMGYLKKRKDIPEDIRKVLLGEITDPAYLSAVGVGKPMRDMALLDWMDSIAGNEAWIAPNSVVDYRGGRVSVHWLKDEAARIRKQADYYEPADAKRARDLAADMEQAVEQTLGKDDFAIKDFKQIPNTARYGRLRGMLVRREIFDDIMGVGEMMPNDPNWFQSLFGYGGIGTRATQLWKLSKVALNPPGQVRNFVSNAVMLQLSGVGLHRLPIRLAQAIHQITSNGKYYQIAKEYGVTESTFTAQELGRIKRDLLNLEMKSGKLNALQKVTHIAGIIGNGAGDLYQKSETIFKTAKIIDAIEQGATPAEAAMEAQKWLFDYSLVPQSVRYMRNAPIGVPFATYVIKVLPRMMEVAITAPWRFAPWVGLFYGLQGLAASAFDLDDDDLDKLKKSMPQWLQDRGHAAILPYKDEHGRLQVIDLGYFFPWAQWTEFARHVATGQAGEALQDAGLFSGPITDIIVAMKTGKDPFTKHEIYNSADPAPRQAADIVNYVWDMAMPPFLGSHGIASPMGLIDKRYGGKMTQAFSGTTDRFGDPRASVSQAALSLIGANIYAVDADKTRASNTHQLLREISDVRYRMKQMLRDKSLTPAQQQEIVKEYKAEIRKRALKVQQYQQESK